MNEKDKAEARWSMLIVVELDRGLLQHFDVRQWNDFVGELARRGMTPIGWAQGERPPPVGVTLSFRGLRRAHYRLTGIDLTLCELEGADFEGACLQGAKLGFCPKANFRYARLQGASFRADVSGVDFTGAELQGAEWGDAYYFANDPPVGLPTEVLAACQCEPASAPGNADMPSTPPERPLRACVTITEVPW